MQLLTFTSSYMFFLHYLAQEVSWRSVTGEASGKTVHYKGKGARVIDLDPDSSAS